MFKVECPGCKAPYQVDERRVPSSGLKMRCPKCGNSFQVESPPDPRTTGPSPVLGGAVAIPTPDAAAAPAPPGPKPPIHKATMIGFGGVPGGAKPPLGKPPVKATLLGTAVPASGAAPGAPPAPPRPAPPRPGGARPPPAPPRPGAKPLSPLAGEIDLPAPAGRSAGSPAAAAPGIAGMGAGPGEFADFGDIGIGLVSEPPGAQPADEIPEVDLDLPAPVGASGSGFEIDLPAAVAPRAGPRPDSGELDLPVVGGRGPEPPRAISDLDLPAVSPGAGFGAADLPAVPRADLPAPARGFGEVDLPSVGAGGRFGDLPSPLAAGLPVPAAGLPVPAAGLPVPAAGLPVPAAALPMPAGTLPALAAGLPTAAETLPMPVAPGLPTPFGGVSRPPGYGSAQAGASGGFGTAGRPETFGELDFGEGPAPSVPPGAHGAGAAHGGPGAPAPDAAGITRQAGGGTAFGEVNLEGGDASAVPDARPPSVAPRADDDMEFGGIPQEGAPGIGIDVRGPRPAAQPVPEIAVPRRRGLRAIVAVVVVLAVGGGALALVPNVGPFGVVWIYDRVRGGEYQKLLTDTSKAARENLAADTYPRATKAYQEAEAARGKAKRVRGIATYVVYIAYARDLRFGADPEASARAQVLLDEYKQEKEKDVPNLELARAAQAAAAGQLPKARAALESLARSRPNDIDILTLRGEVELRAKDAAAALSAWQAAAGVEKSARTAFGLARAQWLGGERKEAERFARQALESSPEHAGGRVLIARATWNQGQEAGATKLLEEVTGAAGTASPEEMVDAQTLLGDIHLARSRITHAENAFSAALKIDPKAARALVGLGDTLYRAGRFSEALARFEAASQADAADVGAKVGVAKAYLALERIQDATGAVTTLREANPKSMLVAYWFGKVQEAVGNRKEAEDAYRQAMQLGEKDPDVAQPYVALALLYNTLGRNEEAQKILSDARTKLPDSVAIRIAMGDLALSQGRYADAVSEFQAGLKVDPGDMGAKFRLGVAYRRDRKFDDAGKAFDDVAAVDKDYPGLALERGMLFEASGRAEEALKAYEGALEKAPNDPDLMLRVGCGKVSTNQAKDAATTLRKVLEKRPNSAEALHCLGRALLVQGTNLAEALKTLERATDIDPNRAEYHVYVGWAANEAGRVARAESALAKALELDKGQGDAYWQRGVLRYRQGAVRDAVKDLQKALELKPGRVEAHAALADSYYDLGKEAEAMAEWNLAIEAQPENPTWRFRFGRLLAANHRNAEAQAQLNKSLELGDKAEPKPRWLWEAHHLLARSMGASKEAAPHWEAFLRLGPQDSPYRAEAKKVLAELGRPWEGP